MFSLFDLTTKEKNYYPEIISLWFPSPLTIVYHIKWWKLLFGSTAACYLLTSTTPGLLKKLPNQPIQTLTFLVGNSVYHPTYLLDELYTSLIISILSLYSFHFLQKFSNYLLSQNIKIGRIIWFVAPTSQICINWCKFMNGICHTYGNRWIELNYKYTCRVIRVNLRLTSPYSDSLLLSPLSPPISFILLYWNPSKN